jgi:hypothetical protein
MLLFLGLILAPWRASAQEGLWSAEGVIGDYAPQSRIYQVGNAAFRVPSHAVVEGPGGKRISMEGLKGGMRVRVEGVDLLGRGAGTGIGIRKVVVLGDR